MSEWISVKERLPEVPEGEIFVRVLGYYDPDGIEYSSTNCEILRFYVKNDYFPHIGWHSDDLAYIFETFIDYSIGLTHWMPLPEPPVESKTEEENTDADT